MYISPKFIIVDFLRNRLTDPRSTRTYTSTSDSFTATASQTSFSLTPSSGKSLSSVTSVTVDAASKSKWTDYYIDFRDEKIIFYTAMTGGEAVVVNYKESSTDWIYWDKVDDELTASKFPRISVMVVSGNGNRLGEYNAPVESEILFQIDVWCKEKAENQIFTIDSKKYTGQGLSEYLAYQIMQTFEDYESDLHPALYQYNPTSAIPRDLPFDDNFQCFHNIVEFTLKGISIGRIS